MTFQNELHRAGAGTERSGGSHGRREVCRWSLQPRPPADPDGRCDVSNLKAVRSKRSFEAGVPKVTLGTRMVNRGEHDRLFSCVASWATIRVMPEYPTDWDFYITFRDDHLASVMVNLALREVAPIESLPECVTIRVPLREPNEQGLCTAEERPQMDAIEDALRDELASTDGLLFVGRRITGGQFELVFFAADGSETDGGVARVMSRYPGYDAELQLTADPGWETYADDLYPNPVELRQILNQRVLRTLESHGDRLSQERLVRHWIDFENALARADFLALIDGRGFSVEETDADEAEVRPFRLRLERSDAVDHNSINELTIELMLLAEQHEGVYDGWETEVVR